MNKKLIWILILLLLGLVACSRGGDSEPAATATPTPPAWPDDPQAAAEQLVAMMVAGQYADLLPHFDATMQEALPASKLQEAWIALNTQLGLFQKTAGTRIEVQEPYQIVYVTCEFEQDVLDAKVVFDQDGLIAGLFFVPSQPSAQTGTGNAAPYVDLDSIQEEEVTVGSGVWKMPGTLTLPLGDGPFPAVVLVHGSGPNDRDESIGPNKPFRDLAWGLASRGIAVLRYDKRTLIYATQMSARINEVTVNEETVDDALAAVQLLRYDARIASDRIFVLGHSLGGLVAPRIAAQSADVAGIIIMAGNTRPLEDLIVDQVTYLVGLDGETSAEEQAQLDVLAEQVALVRDPSLSAGTPAENLPLGIPAAYWLDLRDYSPAQVAGELSMPILILQGERDYQVSLKDYEGWQAALDGRANVTFHLYPDLNHLFMSGTGPGSPAEYEVSGHVAEPVVNDIVDWVLAH